MQEAFAPVWLANLIILYVLGSTIRGFVYMLKSVTSSFTINQLWECITNKYHIGLNLRIQKAAIFDEDITHYRAISMKHSAGTILSFTTCLLLSQKRYNCTLAQWMYRPWRLSTHNSSTHFQLSHKLFASNYIEFLKYSIISIFNRSRDHEGYQTN